MSEYHEAGYGAAEHVNLPHTSFERIPLATLPTTPHLRGRCQRQPWGVMALPHSAVVPLNSNHVRGFNE